MSSNSETLPTLYHRNQHGKVQQWRTWTEGKTVFTEYGQRDGKLRVISRDCVGKNVGRSNETSPEAQALLEAKSKWTEQQTKKLYTLTEPEEVLEGKLNVLPMLAEKLEGNEVKYPAYTQPKLDGCRALSYLVEGKVKCYSRNHKEWPYLTKIKEKLFPILQKLEEEIGPCALDGELYSHHPEISFQVLTSIARTTKQRHEREDELEYWIFDLIPSGAHASLDYSQRWALLSKYLTPSSFAEIGVVEETLKLLNYDIAQKKEDLYWNHRRYIEQGFEGTMIRDPEAPYLNKRTKTLLKLKDFYDEEGEIVGAEQGEGVEQGCVVWILKDKEGRVFKARPRGSHSSRREAYLSREQYLGKLMTFRFQERTDEGIPRFPVALTVRDYE